MSKTGIVLGLWGCMALGSGVMAVETEQDTAQAASVEMLADVESVIEEALEKFDVPGVAVGVVVDGKVVLAKGYGLRDKEKKLPVTAETLFPIGSCTKAFTTLILGQLVEEGLIAWDDPVIKHIPEFRLKDPHATLHLTIRDAVTHRSGLPRHDFFWYNSSLSRNEIISHLPHLDLSADLREKFQYNNLMYTVAGIVIERVTGRTFEEVVKERIFTPLEMDRSNLSVHDLQKTGDFSLPYVEKEGALKAIPFRDLTIESPAGAINSSINDMVRWVAAQLSSGKTIVQPGTLKEMHTIQIGDPALASMGLDCPEELMYNFGYGLGWVVGTYKGHYFVWHNGGIDGFISNVSLLPQEKIGLIVFSNSSSDGHFAVTSISNTILDRLLGASPNDWVAKLSKKREEVKIAMQSKKKEEASRTATQPARPIGDYAGTYEHPGYGLVEVFVENGALTTVYNGRKTILNHHCYDNFKGITQDAAFEGESSFVFYNNLNGEISELRIPYEPMVQPIAFKKRPSNTLLSSEYLKQFEGIYEGLSITVQVQLKAGRLSFAMAGQPSAELVPEKSLQFSIKGVQECEVRFEKGSDGLISVVHVSNPYGLFTFKRSILK